MSIHFSRKIEDFVCENCGAKVKGNGFTNHCPHCLWCKHVDINPGDRMSDCRGLMKPARVEIENGKYVLIHRCIKCGYEKRNKVSEKDNFEEIINITNSLMQTN